MDHVIQTPATRGNSHGQDCTTGDYLTDSTSAEQSIDPTSGSESQHRIHLTLAAEASSGQSHEYHPRDLALEQRAEYQRARNRRKNQALSMRLRAKYASEDAELLQLKTITENQRLSITDLRHRLGLGELVGEDCPAAGEEVMSCSLSSTHPGASSTAEATNTRVSPVYGVGFEDYSAGSSMHYDRFSAAAPEVPEVDMSLESTQAPAGTDAAQELDRRRRALHARHQRESSKRHRAKRAAICTKLASLRDLATSQASLIAELEFTVTKQAVCDGIDQAMRTNHEVVATETADVNEMWGEGVASVPHESGASGSGGWIDDGIGNALEAPAREAGESGLGSFEEEWVDRGQGGHSGMEEGVGSHAFGSWVPNGPQSDRSGNDSTDCALRDGMGVPDCQAPAFTMTGAELEEFEESFIGWGGSDVTGSPVLHTGSFTANESGTGAYETWPGVDWGMGCMAPEERAADVATLSADDSGLVSPAQNCINGAGGDDRGQTDQPDMSHEPFNGGSAHGWQEE